MCNLETEGTKYGCGHYQQTKVLKKLDCSSPHCIYSRMHPSAHDPHFCPCNRYYGPDAKEIIRKETRDYCSSCAEWFQHRR